MNDRPMHSVPGLFGKLQALYAEGEALLEQGDPQGAVDRFSEIIGLDDHFRQRYITAYAQRAFAYHRVGCLAEACADYSKAIEMEPPINQAQYYFQRGMAEAALGQTDEALRDYNASIELHQGHPGPYHLRGKLLADTYGRFADAIPDFDRLLELNPNPDGYQYRGLCKVQVGAHAEAIKDLEQSLAMHPGNHFVEYLLACCAAVLGNTEEMYQHMQNALQGDDCYREYFREDDEFSPYRTEARFQRLV
ncbi:MAG: tetratricopeptide repeat protein [Polyangiaceae bacterium]